MKTLGTVRKTGAYRLFQKAAGTMSLRSMLCGAQVTLGQLGENLYIIVSYG